MAWNLTKIKLLQHTRAKEIMLDGGSCIILSTKGQGNLMKQYPLLTVTSLTKRETLSKSLLSKRLLVNIQ